MLLATKSVRAMVTWPGPGRKSKLTNTTVRAVVIIKNGRR